jgi:hypothetical protein
VPSSVYLPFTASHLILPAFISSLDGLGSVCVGRKLASGECGVSFLAGPPSNVAAPDRGHRPVEPSDLSQPAGKALAGQASFSAFRASRHPHPKLLLAQPSALSLRLHTGPELRPYAIMALRLPRALTVAALTVSCVTSALSNYSSIDMMRAQLALMEDRPKDCPPWYDAELFSHQSSRGMLMVPYRQASTATSQSTRAASSRHVASTTGNATALRASAATTV